MAREEQDREDLIAEATALVVRAELQLPDLDELMVIGFRNGGAGCIYVGSEPVYQFNTRHQLRRCFVKGRMVNARSGRLVELRKERTSDEVNLLSSPLDDRRQAALLLEIESCLERLISGCDRRILRVVRQVPQNVDFLDKLGRWLTIIPRPVQVAGRPNVSG